jgi:hypothetical protein
MVSSEFFRNNRLFKNIHRQSRYGPACVLPAKAYAFPAPFNIIGGFADGYLLAASPFAADPLIKDQPKRWTSRAKAV